MHHLPFEMHDKHQTVKTNTCAMTLLPLAMFLWQHRERFGWCWLTKLIISRQKKSLLISNLWFYLLGLWLYKLIFSLSHQHLHSPTPQQMQPNQNRKELSNSTQRVKQGCSWAEQPQTSTPLSISVFLKRENFELLHISARASSQLGAQHSQSRGKLVLIPQIATHSGAPLQCNTASWAKE